MSLSLLGGALPAIGVARRPGSPSRAHAPRPACGDQRQLERSGSAERVLCCSAARAQRHLGAPVGSCRGGRGDTHRRKDREPGWRGGGRCRGRVLEEGQRGGGPGTGSQRSGRGEQALTSRRDPRTLRQTDNLTLARTWNPRTVSRDRCTPGGRVVATHLCGDSKAACSVGSLNGAPR